MVSNRAEVRLSEVADFSYGKMPNKELLNQGEYPTFSGYKYQHKYPDFNCCEGDVIVVARGVGGTGDIKLVKEKCYLTNLSIKISLDNERVDNKYFYYRFLNAGLRHLDSGSAQSQITINDLNNEVVCLPEISEQKSIAHILGSLDDKIELNLQMNSTLDSMAQELFKSLFVDFDPVIDNALAAGNPIPEPLHTRAETRKALGNKRRPLPEAIQKQFPSNFVFVDDMGWVPDGWEVVKTEEISLKIGMGPFGSNIKVSTFVDSGVPIISGYHLNQTLLTDEKYRFITEDHAQKLKNSIVAKGDLIFTHAGNIGQVALIPENTTYPKYVISQRQFYLRPDVGRVRGSYLIYFFRSHVGQHKLLSNAAQVGVPSIARPSSHLKSLELVLPSLDLLKYFDGQCELVFKSLTSNQGQIESLARLRDTLLPKLLSGQLRIPDAEKLLADAR